MILLIALLISISVCVILHAISNALVMGAVEMFLLSGLNQSLSPNQMLIAHRITDFITPLLIASSVSFFFFYKSMFLYGLCSFSAALPVISYRGIKSNAYYYIASSKLKNIYEEFVLNSVKWRYVQIIQLLIPITGILFLILFTSMYFAIKQEAEFLEVNLKDNCESATISTAVCNGGSTRRLY